MYVYRANIRNQHKTGQIYMLEKGFENYIRVQFAVFTKLTNYENFFTLSRGTHGSSFQLRVSEGT